MELACNINKLLVLPIRKKSSCCAYHNENYHNNGNCV